MSRKNGPDHGSLNCVRGRYYYKVKLPGTSERKTYPLVPAGQTSSTNNRRMAIAVANEMWRRYEATSVLDGVEAEYDGTILTLKELFLKAHKKEIANKDKEVQGKELRFYNAALNDLIAYLKAMSFSLSTYELRPNRIILWRKYLDTEKGVCRTTINKKVNVVKQMIHYATMRELEPAQLLYNIDTIKPIKKGQDNFKDYKEVAPADWSMVQKIMPYLDDMICDMLTIIYLTGARPGEVRLMRPCDIDQTDPQAWVFRLPKHKTRRHGISRNIVIGLSAQKILMKYMIRQKDQYCFPPRKNRHGNTGLYYTSGTFAKIITRAVKRYNVDHPNDQIIFHANRLRHTFATEVCSKHGLEVTRCALGHTSVQMTRRYARQALEAEQLANAKIAVRKLG